MRERWVPLSMILPSCTTRITSARRMVDRRWAMMKEVRPVMTFSMAFWMSCSVTVSTELVASSSTKMRGSASSARAKDSSCFSPVERVLPPSPMSES